ncbi:hypothetical protein [Methylobacterium soli]|uniref:Uncharacterized protein n=1 Tax=Methylobacterium soli TaxID=553447 RepID=A0A6L3SRB8_9HYPH|nr:hypothetical protein [Methylobacterium soli]KAB1074590.1 hypothetical protein F6X53_25740 [Methylobacterium soli]
MDIALPLWCTACGGKRIETYPDWLVRGCEREQLHTGTYAKEIALIMRMLPATSLQPRLHYAASEMAGRGLGWLDGTRLDLGDRGCPVIRFGRGERRGLLPTGPSRRPGLVTVALAAMHAADPDRQSLRELRQAIADRIENDIALLDRLDGRRA